MQNEWCVVNGNGSKRVGATVFDSNDIVRPNLVGDVTKLAPGGDPNILRTAATTPLCKEMFFLI